MEEAILLKKEKSQITKQQKKEQELIFSFLKEKAKNIHIENFAFQFHYKDSLIVLCNQEEQLIIFVYENFLKENISLISPKSGFCFPNKRKSYSIEKNKKTKALIGEVFKKIENMTAC
jgi:hypothetical protein